MSDDRSATRSPGLEYGGRLFGMSDLNLAASSAIEGLPDEQRSSPVRRTLLLLIFFELVLIFVLWLVYVRTLGDFVEEMRKQVIYMKFNTSLFDVQLISLGRFITLEVAYGAFLTSYRWPSVVSTTATTIYIIVKCTEFSFGSQRESSGLCYTVLVLPIVMAWLSTFFLECRVLPQERMAERIVTSYNRLNTNYPGIADVESAQFASIRQWAAHAAPSHYTRSIYVSPEGSLVDETESLLSAPKYTAYGATESPVDVAALLMKAEDLRRSAWSALEDDLWCEAASHLTSSSSSLAGPGPRIASVCLSGYAHKVFRMDGILHARAKTIFNDLVYGFDFSPHWNPTIASARCLQKFPHENLDIVHSVVKDALGGLIKSRDFVLLRVWGTKEGVHFVASSSVIHPKCPPSETCIRAEQLINAVFLQPVGNFCNIVLITSLDLKGWFPGHVVERGVKASLVSFFQALHQRAESLNVNTDKHCAGALDEAC
uniref:START domain-containing protein n=1 Tax=Mesocestoides corti TaxID=53468 RepID=A0A5K3EKZ7_MESCO